MLHVSDPQPLQLLSEDDAPAALVVNPGGRAAICFVCEHASAAIPASLGDLGLSPADRFSHAVWDIGAEALARALASRFDAPLVLGGVSRLVHDCNRPPDRTDAIPVRTEAIDIPGNRDISAAERAARVHEVYDAFHATLSARLDAFGESPAFVTIHSFTPSWHGVPRATEIGLLHDADPVLVRAMVGAAPPDFRIEVNMPYSSADGVTHLLARHAVPKGLKNVMIEVRNDLLAAENQVRTAADALERMLISGLSDKADAA